MKVIMNKQKNIFGKVVTTVLTVISAVICADQAQATKVIVGYNEGVREYDVIDGVWTNGTDIISDGAHSQVIYGTDDYIYVTSTGQKIDRYQQDGTFVKTLATQGTDFTGNIDQFAIGPDGNLYFSCAFGAGNNKIWKIDLTTDTTTLFIDTTGWGGTFVNPRGIAFDNDNNLYVCNRYGYAGSYGNLECFDATTGTWKGSVLSNISRPQGLAYDVYENRLILNSGSGLFEVKLGGSTTNAVQVFASDGDWAFMGLAYIDGGLYFTEHDHDRLDLVYKGAVYSNILTNMAVESISFKDLPTTSVLLSAQNDDKVFRYSVHEGVWTPDGVFASNAAPYALDAPCGLARDAWGRVYVTEVKSGGRLLRFDSDGNFINVVGTSGVDFSGWPISITDGPQSEYLYMTAGTRVYKIDARRNSSIAEFIPTSGSGAGTNYTFTSIQGLAFDDSGTLYVANYGGTGADQRGVLKFDALTGNFLGYLDHQTLVQALHWDKRNKRLYQNRYYGLSVYAYEDANPANELKYYNGIDDLGNNVNDIEYIDGKVHWTSFDNDRVDQHRGFLSDHYDGNYKDREVVVTGVDGPRHMLIPPTETVVPPLMGTVILVK